MKKEIPGQQQAFDPGSLSARQFEPISWVQEGAKQMTGGKWTEPDPQHQVNRQRATMVHRAITEAMADPRDRPGMNASYDELSQHIHRQHEFMTTPVEQGGMGIRHELVQHDPYPSAVEMSNDLRSNRRIQTLATTATDSDTDQSQFDVDTNDKFRAVHDVFGHGATGRGFGEGDEDAAYLSHAQMFPPRALRALGADLRAQNSYYYRGDQKFADVGGRRLGVPGWVGRPTSELPKRLTNAGQKKPKVRPGTQGTLGL